MFIVNDKIDLKELPPTASEWGKNSLTHKCESATGPGGTNSVNVCMNVVKAVTEGRLKDANFPKCHAAIADGTCTAMIKRQEEVEAGHAIYYKEYLPRDYTGGYTQTPAKKKEPDRNSESYKRGWNSVGKNRELDVPEEKKPAKNSSPVVNAGEAYQAAINNAVSGDEAEVSSVMIAVGKKVLQALEKSKSEAMKDPSVKKSLFTKVMRDTCEKNKIEITRAQIERVYLQV